MTGPRVGSRDPRFGTGIRVLTSDLYLIKLRAPSSHVTLNSTIGSEQVCLGLAVCVSSVGSITGGEIPVTKRS